MSISSSSGSVSFCRDLQQDNALFELPSLSMRNSSVKHRESSFFSTVETGQLYLEKLADFTGEETNLNFLDNSEGEVYDFAEVLEGKFRREEKESARPLRAMNAFRGSLALERSEVSAFWNCSACGGDWAKPECSLF